MKSQFLLFLLLFTTSFLVAGAEARAEKAKKAGFLASAGARADQLRVDKDGILRYEWGQVATMNQTDAIKACAQHKMRLPTIRELVKLSRAAGLVIQELTQAEKKNEAETGEGIVQRGSMYPVSTKNPNGKTDQFYYSNEKYTRPSGDLGRNSFWSSSTSWGLSFPYLGYALSGDDGVVGYGMSAEDSDGAVRCVSALSGSSKPVMKMSNL